MKKTGYLILVAIAILLIAVLSNIDESDAAPEPRKRGGGSRKKSGSSGFGSLFGGSKKQNKGYSNSGGKCK